MVIRVVGRQEMGQRVQKAWALSGLTARQIAVKIGEPHDTSLMTRLSQGRANVAERLPQIAMALAGEYMLARCTEEQVLAYLRGERELVDLPIS